MSIIKVNPVIIYPTCIKANEKFGYKKYNENCNECTIRHTCSSPRSLCICPYEGNKKGCPNYNKRKDCPPLVPMFDNYYDMTKPIYAIYEIFNLVEQKQRMKDKHPEWTDKQCGCCLYWQAGVRKRLKENIKEFRDSIKENNINDYDYTLTPEAMGVDMKQTMLNVGIELIFPPKDIIYKIALFGKRSLI